MPEGSLIIDNSFVANLCSGSTGNLQTSGNLGEITVYPNPSHGIFMMNARNGIEQIKVYNLTGKQIYSSKNNPSGLGVDLRGLGSGIYFYQITDKNQFTKSGKIILE
jgi:hypothetical protein